MSVWCLKANALSYTCCLSLTTFIRHIDTKILIWYNWSHQSFLLFNEYLQTILVQLVAPGWLPIYYYRPRSRGDNMFGCIRPSVRPSLCQGSHAWSSKCHFSTGVEWSIVVLGFALLSTAKSPVKHKSGTLLTHHRVLISRGIQNGCM